MSVKAKYDSNLNGGVTDLVKSFLNVLTGIVTPLNERMERLEESVEEIKGSVKKLTEGT